MHKDDFGYTFRFHLANELPNDVRDQIEEEENHWRQSVLSEVQAMRRESLAPEDRERINLAFRRIAEKLGIQAEIQEILSVLNGTGRTRDDSKAG
jgi:hypothetical protein